MVKWTASCLSVTHSHTHWHTGGSELQTIGTNLGFSGQEIKPVTLFYLLSHSSLTTFWNSPTFWEFPKNPNKSVTFPPLRWDGYIRINLNKPLTEFLMKGNWSVCLQGLFSDWKSSPALSCWKWQHHHLKRASDYSSVNHLKQDLLVW